MKKLIKLDDNEIINTIGMANLPLIIYVLQKKYKGRVRFIDISGDCMIRYGESNIANMSYLATCLHFLKLENQCIHLEGNVSIPYVFREYCTFHVYINDIEVPCKLFDAGLDLKIGKDKYEDRSAFQVDYPLDNTKGISYEITFRIITNGVESTCNKINSMRFMPVADVLPYQYADMGDYIACIKENRLCLIRKTEGLVRKAEDLFVSGIKKSSPETAQEIIALREQYYYKKKIKKKPIWLFFDRFDKADDNGEVLFDYVNRNYDEKIDAYYVISANSPDYIRLSKIGKVVSAFSAMHKLLLLCADYIFTSQLNGFVENPFGNDCEYFRDLYHNAKVIFLQHGVTKDDQSSFLHRYEHNMYSVIVSSPMERKEFLRDAYGLKTDQVWLTGMPRFDRLYHNEQRQIVIMPTWRKSFMYLKEDKDIPISRWVQKEGVRERAYVRKYNRLLNSKFLYHICKKYNYKVVFVPHPLSRPYEGQFHVPTWIKKSGFHEKYNDIFAESDLMITDYSSVAFDFAYLKKPVIYYQFDKRKFFKDHTYIKGYFDYKKQGFGDVCRLQVKLIYLLRRKMKNHCRLEKYELEKICDFYCEDISNSCERLLNMVM